MGSVKGCLRLGIGLAVVALFTAGCSTQSDPPAGSGGSGGSGAGGSSGSTGGSRGGSGGASGGSGGSSATGGAGGSGGSTGGSGAGGSGGVGGSTGGAGGTGGSGGSTGGIGGAADAKPADSSGAPDQSGGETAPAGDGTALVVVGPQIIGTDLDIVEALKAKNLKVETIVDSMATTAHTKGKSLVVLSYSLDSDNFKADYSTVEEPIILMERGLLARLGMTSSDRWAEPVTTLTIVAADSPLAAGLPAGDHVVFSKPGEFFWGAPSAAAIKVATVKGDASKWVIFAYPKDAMMVGKKAAGKRLHFFFGAHLVPDKYLNDTGKKLLGAAIDWSVK
jgi:hypothetical protein